MSVFVWWIVTHDKDAGQDGFRLCWRRGSFVSPTLEQVEVVYRRSQQVARQQAAATRDQLLGLKFFTASGLVMVFGRFGVVRKLY